MIEIFNPINCVEFVYTQKCNIRCAHCIINCSPEAELKLDLNRVLLFLKELPEFKIKEIGITGGESLLFFDEVIEIISAAKNLGIKPKLISNGFWASTPEKTEEILSKLYSAGLRALNISSDHFHSKFIPEQNVLNIMRAVKKKKDLDFSLRTCITNDYSLLDFMADHKDYFDEIKEKNLRKNFSFFFQFIVPQGRAFANLSKEKFPVIKEPSGGACRFLGLFTVNYNSKCFICCNGLNKSDVAFELGDFSSDSFEELVKAYRKSLFVFYLRVKGPYYVNKLAEKHNLRKVYKTEKLAKGYTGMCNYCVATLAQYAKKDMENMLLQEFEKDRKMQKLAKKEIRKNKKDV